MARLRILPLPGNGHPFAVVLDRVDSDEIAAMGLAFNGVIPDCNPFAQFADSLGARTVILSEREIELPGDEPSPSPADSDTCHVCVGGPADQWNPLGQPFCWPCADCQCAENPCVRTGINDPKAAEAQMDAAKGLNVRNKDQELRAANEWIERLSGEVDEARQWARHGYEIGQRHCGWTDHGVAPTWLTDGWPRSTGSCEHLKLSADLDTRITRARDLHRAADHRGQTICNECSIQASLGDPLAPATVPWPCSTIKALDGTEEA